MNTTLNSMLVATAASLAMSVAAYAAGPEIVKGPSKDAECFKPLTAETKFFQWPKKEGPYRIALANGFIGNTWRIQMIQTAKAYAALAGSEGEAQGIQGGLDGRRCRRTDCCGR